MFFLFDVFLFGTQDYLVFMPEEYYEGTILQTERVDPCVVGGPNNKVCDRYSYPEVAHESIVKQEAENGYFSKRAWHADEKLTLKYYSNSKVLKQLGTNGMVVMNKEQVSCWSASWRVLRAIEADRQKIMISPFKWRRKKSLNSQLLLEFWKFETTYNVPGE